jgi:hypothetical protein
VWSGECGLSCVSVLRSSKLLTYMTSGDGLANEIRPIAQQTGRRAGKASEESGCLFRLATLDR